MLRASAKKNGLAVNLKAMADRSLDLGLENGEILLAFADACVGNDVGVLNEARAALVNKMGSGALVQAAAIAGNFSMNDTAANAIGIPMESMFLGDSEDYRAELGINEYLSARNSLG
ncbi:MAG: hypothetical protein ACU84Q_02960 [Gammaproteobacteria bacterium]